ncbi:MAG TPA: LysR family transcriptional regulator [Burkholderiaceae bacterium]|nr:LysR family transcriptional regulator [Burkholderiaceae bacterium]
MNPRDIRSLDIGMLRTFDALMRERSVSRAAARLFLSQPAVSASLSRLRETFDDPLFSRTAHGVTPTPRALALAPPIEKVLDDIAALLESEQPFDPATSSRIFRIAGSDHASRGILPELGRLLAAAGSGIRIVWEPPGTWSIPERLQKRDLDLAVIARIKRPRDMECVTLYEDRYVYAMRVDHPRAGEPVTLDLFCEIPQIFLGYGSSILDDTIDDILARAGRQRLAQFAVTSFGQIVHQLQHSDHAAVLGFRVAQAHAEKLRIQPLPFALPTYQALLCWDARASGDAGIQWIKEALVGILGQGARHAPWKGHAPAQSSV